MERVPEWVTEQRLADAPAGKLGIISAFVEHPYTNIIKGED
jgi:hypothetical protein